MEVHFVVEGPFDHAGAEAYDDDFVLKEDHVDCEKKRDFERLRYYVGLGLYAWRAKEVASFLDMNLGGP